MMNFIREGGFGMIVLLILGAVSLWSSGAFAWKPDPRRVQVLESLHKVMIFSSIMAVATDLSAVFHKVPGTPEWAHSPEMHLIVMQGLGESLAPAVLGFAILTVMSLLMSLGYRKLARQM